MHRCSYQSARTVSLHTNSMASTEPTNERIVCMFTLNGHRRMLRVDWPGEGVSEMTKENCNALDAWPMSTLIFHSILSRKMLSYCRKQPSGSSCRRRRHTMWPNIFISIMMLCSVLCTVGESDDVPAREWKIVCKHWALLHILLLLYKWQWIWTTFGYCVLATATASWAKRRRMATAAAAVAKIKLKKKNSTCQEPKDQIEE